MNSFQSLRFLIRSPGRPGPLLTTLLKSALACLKPGWGLGGDLMKMDGRRMIQTVSVKE
jgi:hypothetical protein